MCALDRSHTPGAAAPEAARPLDPAALGFRPLGLAELPLIHHWLNAPWVACWWPMADCSQQAVLAKYARRARGETPTRCFIILHAERAIGLIQTYRLTGHADYAQAVQAEPGAAGVDLFIGEREYLHRGLGAPILRRFLREVVFAPGAPATACYIGPDQSNAAAIRAYEKAGFLHLRTVTIPGEEEPEQVMRLSRADFEAGMG